MANHKPNRSAVLARMSDVELEVTRHRAAVDRDLDLLEGCVTQLVLRGASVLVAKCRELGEAISFYEEKINLVIEEATWRFMAALGRRDPLPAVRRFVDQIATECIDAQANRPAPERPRLTPRKPNLRPLDDNNDGFEPRSNGRRHL